MSFVPSNLTTGCPLIIFVLKVGGLVASANASRVPLASVQEGTGSSSARLADNVPASNQRVLESINIG